MLKCIAPNWQVLMVAGSGMVSAVLWCGRRLSEVCRERMLSAVMIRGAASYLWFVVRDARLLLLLLLLFELLLLRLRRQRCLFA